MRNKQYDRQWKIVMSGNSSVGKSCLLLRFADDQFIENHISTIGVDFRFKTFTLDGKKIKLQIWDTAGQDKYRTITNTYYKKAQAVVMVYDITDQQSFQDVDKFWLGQVEAYADEGIVIVLVGNKSDLNQQRKVSYEQGQAYANSKNMLFFEASAKTADHVKDIFENVSRRLGEKIPQKPKRLQHQQNKKITMSAQGPTGAQGNQKGYCC